MRYTANALLIVLLSLFLVKPAQISDAQQLDSVTLPNYVDSNKKTPQDVQIQDARKQELFKKAFTNQDTVTLLISKKKKPKIIQVYHRVPVIIPIYDPRPDYLPVKSIKDSSTYVKDIQLVEKVKQPIKLSLKKKHHSFLYRIFHKK